MEPEITTLPKPRSAACTVLLTALALSAGCGEAPRESVKTERSVEAASPAIVSILLSPGGTLDSALTSLEIPAELRPALIRALAEHVDLRRLPARTGLAAVRTPDGRLIAVTCRPAREEYIRLDLREEGGIVTTSVTVPVERKRETASGSIDSSVAQALGDHEDGLALTAAYADIFQWDIDLLVDPRPGDSIRIAYEVEVLGEIAPDLPPFGRTPTDRGERMGIGSILAASYEGEKASAVAYLVVDDEGLGEYYDPDGNAMRKTFLKSPLNYRRISSGFTGRRRHPITRRISAHYAVDFAAPSGTPVVAAADGKVVSVGWDGHLGRAIRIRHGSEYTTLYGHLKGYARGIRKGATVRQNQLIGFVGSSGRTTGPHLHYAMYRNGSPINPLRFKSPSAEPLPEELRPRLLEARSRLEPVLASISREPEEEDSLAGG